MPSAAIYVYWDFTSPVEVIEWDITVHRDPGTSVGEYLALFNGSIDGSTCYLGLQTDIFHPDKARGIGKGVIFSTWWSFDERDSHIAPTDGFRQLGTHEGRFIGVRRPYQWTMGDYRIALSRADTDEVDGRSMDWFDLTIEPTGPMNSTEARAEPTGPREWIGAMRFPRREQDRPAAVEPGGLMFLEIYSGANAWSAVTPWHVDVMAYGDGVRCPSGRTEYPSPYGKPVLNASAHYNSTRARIDLSLGNRAEDQHPPGLWP